MKFKKVDGVTKKRYGRIHVDAMAFTANSQIQKRLQSEIKHALFAIRQQLIFISQ